MITPRKNKFSARREIKKLDAFCRKIVFARDGYKCARCGKGKDQAALHWAHVITRAAKSTRWHLDNSMVLDYYCHFRWAHERPLEFAEFVRENLGEERYAGLIARSNRPQQLTPEVAHGWFSYLSGAAQKYGVRTE